MQAWQQQQQQSPATSIIDMSELVAGAKIAEIWEIHRCIQQANRSLAPVAIGHLDGVTIDELPIWSANDFNADEDGKSLVRDVDRLLNDDTDERMQIASAAPVSAMTTTDSKESKSFVAGASNHNNNSSSNGSTPLCGHAFLELDCLFCRTQTKHPLFVSISALLPVTNNTATDSSSTTTTATTTTETETTTESKQKKTNEWATKSLALSIDVTRNPVKKTAQINQAHSRKRTYAKVPFPLEITSTPTSASITSPISSSSSSSSSAHNNSNSNSREQTPSVIDDIIRSGSAPIIPFHKAPTQWKTAVVVGPFTVNGEARQFAKDLSRNSRTPARRIAYCINQAAATTANRDKPLSVYSDDQDVVLAAIANTATHPRKSHQQQQHKKLARTL